MYVPLVCEIFVDKKENQAKHFLKFSEYFMIFPPYFYRSSNIFKNFNVLVFEMLHYHIPLSLVSCLKGRGAGGSKYKPCSQILPLR